jgi:hypothetical protein
MVKEWRYKLTLAATNVGMLLGFGTGIAMAYDHCNGDYHDGCHPDFTALVTCCSGGVVANCTQQHYYCVTGTTTTYIWSAKYGCGALNPITNCT